MAAADLECWFATQTEFVFYGSSLLFAFDAGLAGTVMCSLQNVFSEGEAVWRVRVTLVWPVLITNMVTNIIILCRICD